MVPNAKGLGSGPNGGPDFDVRKKGSDIGNLMGGVVSLIDLPPDDQLAKLSAEVAARNFKIQRSDDPIIEDRSDNPIPLHARGSQGPIESIVFITKENRSYDEVFGQIEGGEGEASMARFGEGVRVVSRDGKRSLDPVDVMPNHLALARRFAISDNFNCDSDVSADGHRWLVGVHPNQRVETGVAASYGGKRSFRWPSTAPGIFGLVGSSGAIHPKDDNEAGSTWDHFHRHQLPFFNFGLGFELNPGIEKQAYKNTGVRLPVNYPLPGPLFSRTSRIYPTDNMQIPDQFRVDRFREEYRQRWKNGKEPWLSVITKMTRDLSKRALIIN